MEGADVDELLGAVEVIRESLQSAEVRPVDPKYINQPQTNMLIPVPQ